MKQRLAEHLATVAHLVVLGFAGLSGLIVIVTLFFVGVGTVPAFGVGFLVLAVTALLVAAAARAEEMRVAGLYRQPYAMRPLRRSDRTTWTRVPHTLWLQFTDRDNLRSIGQLAIFTLLGLTTLWLLQVAAQSVAVLIAGIRLPSGTLDLPYFGITTTGTTAVFVGAGLLLATIGLVAALVAAHRAIATSMRGQAEVRAAESLARQATQRTDSAVHAAEVERTRIERDLHDGVQPRLVSVGMTLGMARAKMESDPAAAAALIEEAHLSTKTAITELRQLARGIHPAVLTDRGLDAALSALAARSPIPVFLDVRVTERCSSTSEAAVYFAVAEAITNATKHARATSCRVVVAQGARLTARVDDDGVGGARIVPGGGLDGIAGRVHAAGGTFSLTSPAGGPTMMEVSVPCAS